MSEAAFARGAWERAAWTLVRDDWLRKFEALRGAAAEGVLHEALGAVGAEVEAFLAIGVGAGEGAVFIEFIVALEHLVQIFEMVAIFVDAQFIVRRGRVQLHLYDEARFVMRIDLALAKVANVTNHLATILSSFECEFESEARRFIVMRVRRSEQVRL